MMRVRLYTNFDDSVNDLKFMSHSYRDHCLVCTRFHRSAVGCFSELTKNFEQELTGTVLYNKQDGSY